MKAYHVRDGDDPVTIHPLHPTCAGGDHYLATPDHFYIIKGDECRRVKDLSTGADPTTFTLHEECRNGDFYMAKNSTNFFVIKRNQGQGSFQCQHVESLKDGNVTNHENGMLDKYKTPNAGAGVDLGSCYHWATSSYFYFLKPVTTWNLEYHRTKDLFNDPEKCNDYPVYPPITAFLPGGLALIMGRTFGRWEQLTSIKNNSESERRKITIKRKHGYEKPMLHSVHHEWNISQRERSASLTTEEIFKAVLKRTFHFPPNYGGLAVDATKEDWSDKMEVEESMSVTIQSNQLVYVWQYVLGIGDQVVLYTKHVKKTNNVTAPRNADKCMLIPLPRTQFSEEHNCFATLLQHASNEPGGNCLP